MPWRRLAAHWPLAAPLALAAWLRFSDLLPATFYGDAAEYTEVARSLANDPRDLAYPDIENLGPTPFVSQPPLVLYLFAMAIRATGSFEVGPLAVCAMLGTATVALLYAIGTLLDGRWTGAVAALFLAVLPYHVRASREAQLDAPFTFLATLCILATLLYMTRPSDRRALLLGAAVAATAMAKLPGALIVAVIAIPLALHWWHGAATAPGPSPASQSTQAHGRRTPPRHLALALMPSAAALAIYLGLLWHLRATTNLLEKLAWQAGRVAGTDTQSRPWHWYFTETHVGLLGQVGGLLLLLAAAGTVLAVVRAVRNPATRPGLALALAWVFVLLALLAASDRKEWFYALPVNPALCLLAALPVGLAIRRGLARLDDQATRTPVRAGAGSSGKAPARPQALAVVLVALSSTWAPGSATLAGPGLYGEGVREAALWIHADDPSSGQVGTTLGRFTLHLYNGQTTYHYWLNHSFVDDEVRTGAVRFVVVDPYTSDAGEMAWVGGLVARHAGELAKEFGPVQVYRVGPRA